MGNLLGGISAVFSFNCFGNNSFSCGIAVAITIALGQLFRCLHPPAGAVALLGVISQANLNFVLSPVLIGSIVLVAMYFVGPIMNTSKRNIKTKIILKLLNLFIPF